MFVWCCHVNFSSLSVEIERTGKDRDIKTERGKEKHVCKIFKVRCKERKREMEIMRDRQIDTQTHKMIDR